METAVPPRNVTRANGHLSRLTATPGWMMASCLGASMLLASQVGCQFAASGQNAQGARLFETGQYSAAMQEFQKAIASDPTNADGYYNLARVTHQMGVQRNDPALTEQAEALYNQCLDHQPNHVECYRSLAVLLTETDRSDKAF